MKKIFRVVLAFALFALLFSGCKNPVQGGTKFEGKWKYSSSNLEQNVTFTGTTVLVTASAEPGKWIAYKGTFTFTDTKITYTYTHAVTNKNTEAAALAGLIQLPDPLNIPPADYELKTNITPNKLVLGSLEFIKQ